jgi:hypothetical protein
MFIDPEPPLCDAVGAAAVSRIGGAFASHTRKEGIHRLSLFILQKKKLQLSDLHSFMQRTSAMHERFSSQNSQGFAVPWTLWRLNWCPGTPLLRNEGASEFRTVICWCACGNSATASGYYLCSLTYVLKNYISLINTFFGRHLKGDGASTPLILAWNLCLRSRCRRQPGTGDDRSQRNHIRIQVPSGIHCGEGRRSPMVLYSGWVLNFDLQILLCKKKISITSKYRQCMKY